MTHQGLIKSVQLETDLKKDPWNYYYIGASYESGPYATLVGGLQNQICGQRPRRREQLALENVNQVSIG